MKLRILVVFSPKNTTVPVNPSYSIVSPTSYCPSVIIEKPAIMSFAKSWKAKPIIAVVTPNPAIIDVTLTPNVPKIVIATMATIRYFIIFNTKLINVSTL